MARYIDETADVLNTSIGGASGMAYGTIAIIFRMESVSSGIGFLAGFWTTGAGQWGLYVDNQNLGLWNGSTDVGVSTVITSASNWYCLVMRKASGTTTPRYSLFNYTTAAWSHGDFSGSIANMASATTSIAFDSSYGETLNGHVAVRGIWKDTVKWSADTTGDALLEASGIHVDLNSWFANSPTVLHVFDQSAVGQSVPDLMGSGAGQSSITGTSVSTHSVPSFSYGETEYQVHAVTAGATDATVTAVAVATSTALPAPAIQTGSVVAATAIATTAALPAPTITAQTVHSATAVVTTAALPAPAIQTGSVVSATAIATTTALPAPTVIAATVIPAVSIATVTALPAPAVQQGQTWAGTTVATVTALPAPVVDVAGNATVQPVAIATTAAMPAPSVKQDQTVSATSLATVTALPAPTIQTGSTVAGTAIATVTSITAPTVGTETVIGAVSVATVTALPAPTVQTGSTVSATAIATVIAFPVPTVESNVATGIQGNVYPRSSGAVGGSAGPHGSGGIIGQVG